MNDAKLMQHDLFGGPALVIEPRIRKTSEEASAMFREMARPDMVRVAPDKNAYVPKPGAQVPSVALGKWARQADGTYSLVPVAGRLVRLTQDLCAALGLRDMNRNRKYETMMRLGRAGHIELIKISPGCWLLDLDSWWRHLAECMEKPEMWEEGSDERENYLHVNGLGGWKGKGKKVKVKGKR